MIRREPGDGSEYDCLACGRCCYSGPDYVTVYPEDLVTLGPVNVERYVVPSAKPREQWAPGEDENTRFLRMENGHCAALRPEPGHVACSIYENRPLLCRVFEPGSPACLAARAREPALPRPGA